MADASDLLAIGKITGTHGIRGMVKVHLYSGDDGTLRAVSEFVLRYPDGRQDMQSIDRLQNHGKKTLLALKGYGAINEVQSLVGGELLVRRNQLPATDEDEYYWADLIGLRVLMESGDLLGTLKEIIETGSNDVYVVQGVGKEILIPALDDVVRKVDIQSGMMIVTPPDGLFDL